MNDDAGMKIITGVIMLILCILNIAAIAIVVLETQNKLQSDPTAIQIAQSGIGITIAITGLMAIFHWWKLFRPNRTDSFTGHLLLALITSILCILNIIAMTIFMLETQTNAVHIDHTVLQIAEAGIGITIATTFIYAIYNFSTAKRPNSYNGYGPPRYSINSLI